MTENAKVLRDYTNDVELHASEARLGRICWYTVSGVMMPHDEAVRLLVKHNLADVLPNPVRDMDVFRRVSSAAEIKREPQHGGTYANYLIRSVSERGENEIVRMVVQEVVDAHGRRLHHENLGRIVFARQTSTITYEPIVQNSTAERLFNDVVTEFQTWRGKMNSYGIRMLIQRIVLGSGATMVRAAGGVYFVPETQANRIEALEAFAAEVPSDECSVHSLPLVDSAKQRLMVRKAYESETIDEIDRVMVEISELKRGERDVSTDKYATLVTQYQELMKRTKGYEELLEDALGQTHSRLDLFQRAIIGLREKVK